jgi:hypothetical protein
VLEAATLSPDGRLVATGGWDGTARLWDAATGRPIPGAILNHADYVTAVAFSPDGTLLGAGCADGSARVWDLATFKPVGPLWVQQSQIIGVAFTADGRALLTTGQDGGTRLWPVPEPMAGDADLIALRLQVRTGLRMGPGQSVVPLSPQEWDECRRRWTTSGGGTGADESASVGDDDYHEARARDAEQDGNTVAAVWHLDRRIAARKAGAKAKAAVVDPSDLWLLYARRARAQTTAGRFDAAAADYARAEQLGSHARVLDCYRHRVVDCEEAGLWTAAVWYLDRLIAAEPRDPELLDQRARAESLRRRPAPTTRP